MRYFNPPPPKTPRTLRDWLADAGIPGSTLFATPWGYAIISPYCIS